LLICLIILVVHTLTKKPAFVNHLENYTEPYCIEWEGEYTREMMVYRCYNFKKQEIVCDWNIYEGDVLYIMDLNHTVTYEKARCTRYVPSQYLYTEEIPLLLN
jgi:hypothetical protein